MKEQRITIKVSKEKHTNYQRNTTAFEPLRYEELGKSWWWNKTRELNEFLTTTHQLLTRTMQVIVVRWQRITRSFWVRKTVRGVVFCLVVVKDVLYVIYILLTGVLIFGFQVLVGGLQSPPRKTTHKTTTKPFEPPVDDEWWRKSTPKSAKKSRTIRVIVEVEDFVQ
ncbi:hypothetical protein [Lewinella sp. LCG006]|uniref:hypothetical protein n=1 Tax=Lewinella sp. LCG006 TaxID=3231911 RepID=UPI0034602EBF